MNTNRTEIMKIELEVIDAVKNPPIDGSRILLLMFVGNVDGRGVTKPYFGYYYLGEWHYMNDTVAKGVTHYAKCPSPMDDSKFLQSILT